MNVTVTIDEPGFLQSINKCFEQVKMSCHEAMVEQFKDMVISNFGVSGTSRPKEWAQLSYGYAKKYHKGDRTPTLILSGDMMASVNGMADSESGTVSCDSSYAAIHQWGLENEEGLPMSARPFFPIVGNENKSFLTPEAEKACLDACEQTLTKSLK